MSNPSHEYSASRPYKCLNCGRTMARPTPHWCCKNYVKHKLNFEKMKTPKEILEEARNQLALNGFTIHHENEGQFQYVWYNDDVNINVTFLKMGIAVIDILKDNKCNQLVVNIGEYKTDTLLWFFRENKMNELADNWRVE